MVQVIEIVKKKPFIWSLILATGIFFVSLVSGKLFGQTTVEEVMRQFGAVLEPLASTDRLSILLVLVIFINNAIKALAIVFLGILLGVLPLLFVGVNGFVLGGLGAALESVGGWGYVMASFVPHGIIEIPVILLATALGLVVGMESFKWLARRESRVKSQLSDCLKVYVKWILPGLGIAAIIEVFATPLVIGLANGG
jgi:stage II sporulation protein M